MTVPGNGCNAKVLRPERCEVLDGKPCAACTEDINLEKEIVQLGHSIEKLQTRRRALRTVMNENHDRLIHKFPSEIASHIFIQYAPPNVSRYKEDRSTPLRLGAVCRKWRQLAWATPQLWSSLVVEVTGRGEHPLQFIDEWLERSASLPLIIKFYDYSGQVHEVSSKAIKILNKHSARWYDMHFDIPAYCLHHLCGSSQGNILCRLVLRHSLVPVMSSKFSIFSMMSKPRLTHLKLLTVGLSCVDIIWNNLTVASIYYIGVDECVELIRRAPLLQTLRLRAINSPSGIFPLPNTRIVHPHLHSLELSHIKATSVFAGIFDSVCFPSLEQWIQGDCDLLLENMISFIGGSSRLKIFKINMGDIPCHRVAEFLRHLYTLELLELRSVLHFTHSLIIELLDMLCTSAQFQSLLFLPRLKSLEFVCEGSFPWESLPQIFASSRWRSLKVKVNTHSGGHDIVDKTAKLLRDLVDEGFDLSIGEIDAFQEYEECNY
jgi:hypothetical protein